MAITDFTTTILIGTAMNRITPIDPTQAVGKTKQLFDAVQSQMGMVPNLVRVLGTAHAALEGYLAFSGALASGTFNTKVREQIALTVAESNLCSYCLSAHTCLAANAGLSVEEIADARHANARSDKTKAILNLARSIVVKRGEICDAALTDARVAGLNDGDIIETVANVVVNIFTNYINHVAQTVLDFPEVKPGDLPESKYPTSTRF
jgi:uncharacterized peroxidase-related enzyme